MNKTIYLFLFVLLLSGALFAGCSNTGVEVENGGVPEVTVGLDADVEVLEEEGDVEEVEEDDGILEYAGDDGNDKKHGVQARLRCREPPLFGCAPAAAGIRTF